MIARAEPDLLIDEIKSKCYEAAKSIAAIAASVGCAGIFVRPSAALHAQPPGAILSACPRCGRPCWKLAAEPAELPVGITAACSVCVVDLAMTYKGPKGGG